MKTGLYFGSFNPIHTGHLIIAQHLLNETDLQQVWFVVSPQNPFKQQKTLLNEYDRLYLVNLAIQKTSGFKATDIEFNLPKPSYTIDTLTYLEEKYPQHEFVLIMGSDSLQNLDKWKNAETIMQNYPVYVYDRPGFPADQPEIKQLTRLKAPLLEISATHIRELVQQGKSIRYLVPDEVLDEIEKSGYYKLKNPAK
ncbi:nicotinate-nucleotide adenylyltransferase [Lacibacter cauensis]|uniref:Probable nicotinate-nucleotide adenylyltransferase n=1 Tax=Lacibacter cauensis TaxID=510947 RepID=A0A562SQD3_9BACT|nr:nicotinate (nicotinamide) nucleotide adenylyltransferase [Lacibacter cauensis]TWI82990.1 nicotinate-nucleotide adenylyltransferase [Lacibacter cauensis]